MVEDNCSVGVVTLVGDSRLEEDIRLVVVGSLVGESHLAGDTPVEDSFVGDSCLVVGSLAGESRLEVDNLVGDIALLVCLAGMLSSFADLPSLITLVIVVDTLGPMGH